MFFLCRRLILTKPNEHVCFLTVARHPSQHKNILTKPTPISMADGPQKLLSTNAL